MIKLLSILQRKSDLDVDSFQHHWRGQHAEIVSRLPGLRRYIQSHTLVSGYAKGQPAADGIAELWFDDSAALRALENSDELVAVRNDELKFIGPRRHQQLYITEHVIKDGAIPADGVKNVEFVTRRPDLSVAEFQRHWRETHGPLGAAIETVSRYVQNHARDSSYRDGRQPEFDGVAITWFENTNAMRASASSEAYAVTRADEKNFVTIPLDFIITREHVIIA